MNISLGRLEKIDLRTVWISEAAGFTPWLAQEENLALLGDTIGLDLEFEAQEKDVGPFRADILCKDTSTNNWVLIENQLERADHKHLGQLLTYACGLKTVTLVWIAERFTEEHRAVLDWLNEITDERFNFFGLEVELWRIGGSPVAPKFNIISQPNDWTRSVSDTAKTIEAGDLGDTQKFQLSYWQQFREFLDANGSQLKGTKPRAQHWNNFPIGRTIFEMSALVNTRESSVGVTLTCRGPHAKINFKFLEHAKAEIEGVVGEPLIWNERPNRKTSEISVRLSCDPNDLHDWPRQHAWLKNKLDVYKDAFGPRVKNLDAGAVDLDSDLLDGTASEFEDAP